MLKKPKSGSKPRSKKPKAEAAELNVSFKNASPTKTRRNLGIEMQRDELTLENVDVLLVNSQMDCTIRCDPNGQGDVAGQQKFVSEDGVLELHFVADVGHVTFGADTYRFVLALPLDAVEANEIERFRYRKGKLICSRTGQAKLPPEETGETND